MVVKRNVSLLFLEFRFLVAYDHLMKIIVTAQCLEILEVFVLCHA